MPTEHLVPIQYYLELGADFLNMNQLLGKKIQLTATGSECLQCHAPKEIYRQGFCKSCFFETPNAGAWILRPELSTAHLGIADRDLAFEQKMQLTPHIVYLAFSSSVKVGVTRKTQVPTRWIDQGATQALVFVEVPNRYLAGVAEVALKAYVSDKTNWRKMLQEITTTSDLVALKKELAAFLPEEVQPYLDLNDTAVTTMDFPVLQYPAKVKSLNLKKQPLYTGVLQGVKGQYLLFDDATVFNVRANEGTVVRLEVLD